MIDQATAVVVSVPVELLPSDPDRKAVMLCWVSPGSPLGRPGHSLGHSPSHNTAGQEHTQQTTPLT